MLSGCGSQDTNEPGFRKRALRDAGLCIGWFKMMSVTFYISMYYLVKFNSHGELAFILLILLLVGIVPSVFLGLMLFLGALQESAGAVSVALYTCIILATYDLIVGMLGAAYHVSIADNLYDYILTLAFILLALTSFPAYCHDVFIIKTFRKALREDNCCQ